MLNLDKFNLVPIEEAISYKGKDVVQIYDNYWWLTYDFKVMIGKRGGALCNKDKRVLETLFKKQNDDFKMVQLKVVFIPWDD